MKTFALIHGGGDSASAWDLVEPELRALGHDVVAVDLPTTDEDAGLLDYARTVAEALGERREVTVVAHSLGGFTGPLVCAARPVDRLVMLAAMIPAPGESVAEWWANTGWEEAAERDRGRIGHDGSDDALFFHDVPPAIARTAMEGARDQADGAMTEPWPLTRWPQVETRFLLCRDDRFFPAEWLRGVVRERLGIEPDEIDGGHCVHLSRPGELAGALHAMAI